LKRSERQSRGCTASRLVGWIAHLFHGALFGVLFAAILTDPGLYGVTDWLWKTVVAGLVYGLVLAVFAAGIIMPIWLQAMELTAPAPLPKVTGASVVWHLLYGAVLGATFHYLQTRSVPLAD
jgi:hypothetical protein